MIILLINVRAKYDVYNGEKYMSYIKKLLIILISISLAYLALGIDLFAQNKSENNNSQLDKTSKKKIEWKYKNNLATNKTVRNLYDSAKNKAAQKGETVVRPMKFHGESKTLRNLANIKQKPVPKDKDKLENKNERPLLEDASESIRIDGLNSLVQTETPGTTNAMLGTSFESVGSGLMGFGAGLRPADATMAIGTNHIVHWVNNQYAVFDKTGTVLLDPVPGKILFDGLGNLCEQANRGDPILQYDSMADRWFMSQFAFAQSAGRIVAPYLQCVAISTTNDPLGSYYRYTIEFDSTAPNGFNDYGKLGIWDDAYYTSYNIFEGSPADQNSGVSLCASDRAKMLAGDASATTLCAPTAFYAGGAGFLPADLDGNELPTDLTNGGVFMRYSTTQNLRIVRLKPDFTNSTVTISDGFGGDSNSFIDLPTGSTIQACNDLGDNCIAQPGNAVLLASIGDRLMYRLTYRNRGGVDSLLVTHSVDPDGAGTRGSAVRWYEIRNPLNDPNDLVMARRPFLYQNGTYDPGAVGDRWMGSMAMNKFGDIMVGYSLADATNNVDPSIAVAGRSQSDLISTLQAESIAQVGLGSQTNGRWGDYSTMQVDPVDDTTFWFTTEYLIADGLNWHTRIVSYSFPTTTAMADGDFNVPANWSNGVPDTTKTGTIPAGRTMTVNSNTTIGNLNIEAGGNLAMNANLNVTGSLILGNKIDTNSNTLGLGCNATVSGASAANYVIGSIRKDYCRTEEFIYPTGTANGFSPATANVTNLATNPSSLLIKATQGNRPGMDPMQSAARYWELTETGDLTANITFKYLQSDANGTESNYKLFRFVASAGSTVTPFDLDTTANTISTDGVSNFSHWTVGNLSPTAANVSIAGKVMIANRRVVANALVTLTDAFGNIRIVRTNNFGFFRFSEVQAGQDYIVNTTAKGLEFPTQVLTVDEDIRSLEIISNE